MYVITCNLISKVKSDLEISFNHYLFCCKVVYHFKHLNEMTNNHHGILLRGFFTLIHHTAPYDSLDLNKSLYLQPIQVWSLFPVRLWIACYCLDSESCQEASMSVNYSVQYKSFKLCSDRQKKQIIFGVSNSKFDWSEERDK